MPISLFPEDIFDTSKYRNMQYIWICFFVILLFVYAIAVTAQTDEKPGGPYVYNDTRPSQMGFMPTWDSNGYVFFCLCMGALRFILKCD